MSRLIEQDGPRQIHRQLDQFTASCHDCRWIITTRHQVDAQDALDRHHCEDQP